MKNLLRMCHRCHPGEGRDPAVAKAMAGRPGLIYRAIQNSHWLAGHGSTRAHHDRKKSYNPVICHSRAGGNPVFPDEVQHNLPWIPACAGMTVVALFGRLLLFVALLLAFTTPAQAHEKSDDTYIKKSVTREILANLFGGEKATPKGTKKHSVARNHGYKYRGRGYERTGGDIYLLPNVPHYSLFFEDNDLLHMNLGFETFSNSYASRGGSQDLSKLIFGQQPILIKEILLTSKLASEGNLGVTGGVITNHPLKLLAGQEVMFDASLDQYTASVDYARHFRKGDLTIGFHIPIKLRQQHLKLTNDITSANRTAVQAVAAVAIYDFYKNFSNLEAFVTEVLSRKGIALNKKESVVGMSDVMTYINLDIPSNYFDRFVVGASLLLPTARERDTGKLWSSDLGNGGFTQLAAFASFLWQRSRWLNPYFHVKGTYGFGANVWRRVPRTHTFDGTSFDGNNLGGVNTVNGRMIFGETFNFVPVAGGVAAKTVTTPDSTIRNFADGTKKVKINPGTECLIRVGNTFDAIFSDKGFVDVYYDLFFKGKDHISRHRVDDVYQPGILTGNTASVRHTAGLTYAYQFDEQYRTRVGINYAFAGRNTPQALGAEVSLNFEF